MISRARLKANRNNAKRSTGPKSKVGKRRSSQNAIKHGLRAKKFIPRPDHEVREKLISQMDKADQSIEIKAVAGEIIDTHYALSLVNSAWDNTLTKIADLPDTPDTSVKISKQLELLSSYGRRISSRQKNAIKALENLFASSTDQNGTSQTHATS